MARRRFDPSLARGAAPAESSSAPVSGQPLSVTQISDLIRRTLEDRIPTPLSVVGEVSNLNVRNHWYFSLKDSGAVISCVAWASTSAKLGVPPVDGEQIIARGSVGHYAPQGKTQFYVTAIQRVGAGALEQKFRAVCEELRALGYFEEKRKKPLPIFPRRVAVITSRTGAALQDVLATAAARCAAIEILLIDVRVQGEGSAIEVTRAIQWVDDRRLELGIDAILVTRGGGSIEDLWTFNERIVADAVFGCALPIVAAIGHESDTTIIELVADMRAATPTQAVMRLFPDTRELQRQNDYLRSRLYFVLRRRIELESRRIEGLAHHEFLRRPGLMIARARERLATSQRRLNHVIAALIGREQTRVERLASRLRPDAGTLTQRSRLEFLKQRLQRSLVHRMALEAGSVHSLRLRLEALGPQRVLARGYSITQDREGRIIRSIADVRIGQPIQTRVLDGSFDSTVGANPGHVRPRRPSSSSTPPNQMDLFNAAG
jgi:exodeoxyribonuclease VII large subunit